MKSYLKFAASFWMSAFLATASMSTAQAAKTKKSGGSAANAAPVRQL